MRSRRQSFALGRLAFSRKIYAVSETMRAVRDANEGACTKSPSCEERPPFGGVRLGAIPASRTRRFEPRIREPLRYSVSLDKAACYCGLPGFCRPCGLGEPFATQDILLLCLLGRSRVGRAAAAVPNLRLPLQSLSLQGRSRTPISPGDPGGPDRPLMGVICES